MATPVLTYGSKTWRMTKNEELKIINIVIKIKLNLND